MAVRPTMKCYHKTTKDKRKWRKRGGRRDWADGGKVTEDVSFYCCDLLSSVQVVSLPPP